MNDMKKPYMIFVMLTLVALLLAACGGAPTAPAVPSAGTEQPTQPSTQPSAQPQQTPAAPAPQTPAAQPQQTPAAQPQQTPAAAPATQPAQPAASVPGQDLGGKEWQWAKTATNNGQNFTPTNPADYTVQFAMADGKVAIKADCNNAEGDFMTDGQNIQIMIGGVTRAMCPPGSLSDEFLKELSEASTYKVDGNTLTLTLNSGGTMTFTAGPAAAPTAGPAAATPQAQGGAPASLEGPTWKWVNTTYTNGSTVTSPDPEKYTLRFGQVLQRFIFVADCNNGSGSYTVNGQSLTMKVEGMTRAYCPPPSDDYVQQLGQVTSYKIDGNNLQLALNQNGGTMTFTTAATTPAAGGGGTAATPAAPAASTGSNKQRLTSGVWKWQQSADSAGQTWASPNPNNYTIQFNPDGTVVAKVDCNTSNGTYQADETNLTITLGAMTMMACPPPSLDTLYLQQLAQVSSYFFDGNNLILLWKMDSGSMKFSQ